MQKPDKATKMLVAVMMGVILMLLLILATLWTEIEESEASYREMYRKHVPMCQWAIFINDTKRRNPELSLEAIMEMQPPFPLPKGAKGRVLAPKERVDDLSDCDFVIETTTPNPFIVRSNGVQANDVKRQLTK